jgi:hypothetical protein
MKQKTTKKRILFSVASVMRKRATIDDKIIVLLLIALFKYVMKYKTKEFIRFLNSCLFCRFVEKYTVSYLSVSWIVYLTVCNCIDATMS